MIEVDLRLLDVADFDVLWVWRNDPQTRRMERNDRFVPRSSYYAWLKDGMINPARRVYVASVQGELIGLCEISRDGAGAANVGINLAPGWRGRRLATGIILSALERAGREMPLTRAYAEIRVENKPSLRAFLAAGFMQEPTSAGPIRKLWFRSSVEVVSDGASVAWSQVPELYAR